MVHSPLESATKIAFQNKCGTFKKKMPPLLFFNLASVVNCAVN